MKNNFNNANTSCLLIMFVLLCCFNCSVSEEKSSTENSEEEVDKWSQYVSNKNGLDLREALELDSYEDPFSFQIRDILKDVTTVLVEYPYSLDIDYVKGEYLLLIGNWKVQYFLSIDKNTLNKVLAIENKDTFEKDYGISFRLKNYKLTHFGLDYELVDYSVYDGELEDFDVDIYYSKQTRLVIWGDSVTISPL